MNFNYQVYKRKIQFEEIKFYSNIDMMSVKLIL